MPTTRAGNQKKKGAVEVKTVSWKEKKSLANKEEVLMKEIGDLGIWRVGFFTSVIFTLSIGVELLTPAFPQYFLLLAFVANIAKQIGLGSYLVTNIQTICFNNLGFLLAALLNMLLKNRPSTHGSKKMEELQKSQSTVQ